MREGDNEKRQNTSGESNNNPVTRCSIIAEFPSLRLAIVGTPRAIACIRPRDINTNIGFTHFATESIDMLLWMILDANEDKNCEIITWYGGSLRYLIECMGCDT